MYYNNLWLIQNGYITDENKTKCSLFELENKFTVNSKSAKHRITNQQ